MPQRTFEQRVPSPARLQVDNGQSRDSVAVGIVES